MAFVAGRSITLASALILVGAALFLTPSNAATGAAAGCSEATADLAPECGIPAACRNGYVEVEGQGPSCPDQGGYWVRNTANHHLYTHGPDLPFLGPDHSQPAGMAAHSHAASPGSGASLRALTGAPAATGTSGTSSQSATPASQGSAGSNAPTSGNQSTPAATYPGSGFSPTVAAVHPVVCTPSPDYRSLIIYAVASDDKNNYKAMKKSLRQMVNDTQAQLWGDTRTEFGQTRAYKFQCDSTGFPLVMNVTLRTVTKATASFATITGDLQGRGFTDSKVKYWVYYDECLPPMPCTPGTGVLGQGNLCRGAAGEVKQVTNCNNTGKTFAVNYASDWFTWMHENGHNMGAVQDNAPHSSKGAHCNDGYDIMCYRDGGSAQCPATDGFECGNTCQQYHYDCSHDSYYNPDPNVSGWLASNWNIGDPMNRFLWVGPPAQCADGLDNDGDGTIDSMDLGCSSIDDDDETFTCPGVLTSLPGSPLKPQDCGVGTGSVVGPTGLVQLPPTTCVNPVKLSGTPGGAYQQACTAVDQQRAAAGL